MDQQYFTQLLDRYLDGTASEPEKRLIDEYFSRLQNNEPEELPRLLENDELRQQMLESIVKRIAVTEDAPVVRMRPSLRGRAVGIAATVLVVLAAIYLVVPKHAQVNPPPMTTAARPVVLHPGTNKAILTLSNGKQVDLDSSATLALTDQGNQLSLAGNRLSYSKTGTAAGAVDRSATGNTGYNSLSTPKGGQYQLTLSDGTRVWLNAASSIRYPVAFTGNDRTVELKGEGYFEVAADKDKPFFVKTGKMQVQVLGTHFNVMAYDDEPAVSTTLLEGAVRLNSDEGSALLAPGQQGRLRTDKAGFQVAICDTAKVMAWKDGLFRFKGDDLRTIMRQLTRWYDVNVSFAGPVSSKKYSGTISKYVDAAEVFKILGLAGINFKQEGKTIIVTQSPT